MTKQHRVHRRIVYVGFLNDQPHVYSDAHGRLVLATYVSKSAAQRAYEDVRRADLVFDVKGTRR